jgi:ERCC4-type nuclease
MSITTAIIDSREPQWVQQLRFGASLATVSALEYGDLLATTNDGVMIAVERKTVADLLGSIKDGRIWPQLVGLRAQTPWAYLVICGPLNASTTGQVVTERGETGWNWASLQGAILKAQELGAFVVQCPSDANYEETVVMLSGRSHEATTVIAPAKEAIPLTAGEQILASLPGIGADKVERLLAYTGRPCWALNFLTDTDTRERVPGIGPQTKARIRAALGLHDDEELSVVLSETGARAERHHEQRATAVAQKAS